MNDSDAGYYSPSPGAFLFMLKDGEGRHSGVHQSTKWGVKDGRSAYAVYRGQGCGPCFGEGRDLHVVWNGLRVPCEREIRRTMPRPVVHILSSTLAVLSMSRHFVWVLSRTHQPLGPHKKTTLLKTTRDRRHR
ncbi:unnamed protein product [Ectocarpus sp. 4 AP-2014]